MNDEEFDRIMADMEAKSEAKDKQIDALQRQIFRLRAEAYQHYARKIAAEGYKEVLRVIRDADTTVVGAEMGLSDDDIQRANENDEKIVTAIKQGMTLGEYLEFDSARSWLDRQQEGGTA